MDLNRENMKKIRSLIIFTAIVCLAVMKIDVVMKGIFFTFGILKPFIYGAVLAFVLNIPMSAIENHLLKGMKSPKMQKVKRPASIFLAFLSVIFVIVLVIVTVIPQLIKTMVELGNEIPLFFVEAQAWLEQLFASQPEFVALLEEFNFESINWDSMLKGIVNFMKNGLGSVVTSTVIVASTIIGGVVNLFVSLIFAFYVLAQKERLGNQAKRIIRAYFSARVYERTLEIVSIADKNFTNFITGQCMEAVILGSMFVVAFIGCFVGTFLIMVDDPVKALWFLLLFIVLQQIEGNLIYPHVVGNSVGLPSIWVLAAVTVGGSLMGVSGMLIFIPIVSTIYSLLREDVNMKNSRKPEKLEKNQKMKNLKK